MGAWHLDSELSHCGETDSKKLADRARNLHEFNPMLGFRACRLAILPRGREMQACAIFEAAVEAAKLTGKPPVPQVMVPLTAKGRARPGLRRLSTSWRRRSRARLERTLPPGRHHDRAAAGVVACCRDRRHAEFFSFGTNDLTHMASAATTPRAFWAPTWRAGFSRAIRSSPSTVTAWANWCG
jgi:pyruvate,orthophosphate dikinase